MNRRIRMRVVAIALASTASAVAFGSPALLGPSEAATSDARSAVIQAMSERATALGSYDLTFRQSETGGNPLYIDSVVTTLRVRPTGYAIRIDHKPGQGDNPGMASSVAEIVGSRSMASAAVISASFQQARIIDPLDDGFVHELPRANKCLPTLLLPPVPGIPVLFDPMSAALDSSTEVEWISWNGSEHTVELRWNNSHSVACRAVVDVEQQALPLLIDYGGVEIRTLDVGAVGGVPFPVRVAGAHPETWAAIDAGTVAEPSWRWTIELVETDLDGMGEPPSSEEQPAIAFVPTGYSVSDFISEQVYIADGGSEQAMAVASLRQAKKLSPTPSVERRSEEKPVAAETSRSWNLGASLFAGTLLVGLVLVWRRLSMTSC
jgi:hypothetical protein